MGPWSSSPLKEGGRIDDSTTQVHKSFGEGEDSCRPSLDPPCCCVVVHTAVTPKSPPLTPTLRCYHPHPRHHCPRLGRRPIPTTAHVPAHHHHPHPHCCSLHPHHLHRHHHIPTTAHVPAHYHPHPQHIPTTTTTSALRRYHRPHRDSRRRFISRVRDAESRLSLASRGISSTPRDGN